MKKHYSAVIFDLDGTLLNTLEDLTASINHALRQKGYPLHTQEEVRLMVGNGIRRLVERAAPPELLPDQIEELHSLFQDHYDIHCNDATGPYPGIPALLSSLKTQGFRLAVASNKADSAVQSLRERFFADTIMAAVGARPELRHKPEPDIAVTAMHLLGAVPEETLYVGDSDVDIQTAINAGLDFVCVSWGFRDKEFLTAHGAAQIVDQPEELLSFLQD